MSDNHSAAVCPWCQTEIVWDEEVGPEETCPHCFNELNDYRSLHVHLDGDELELTDDENDELTELNGYELAVKKRLEQQEDVMECARCQDEMVMAGTMNVGEDRFVPFQPSESAPTFLTPPFKLNVFVCPSCFGVAHSLSDDDRFRLVSELSKEDREKRG
ncbi:hypothetical protein [Paenibacillus ginsengarvi]|uniref:Uncharacterized protein n=1 Tax=Paenibacillus ginsengarvi TaxID=400777 RepID=A0A3B0B271_9BACL|nr:hypothetical protein [Paenibacillus ginsengarvi]RKN66094.1 hypothetical protein D7M11_31315 [Paenibacillus ginsengarvi]